MRSTSALTLAMIRRRRPLGRKQRVPTGLVDEFYAELAEGRHLGERSRPFRSRHRQRAQPPAGDVADMAAKRGQENGKPAGYDVGGRLRH